MKKLFFLSMLGVFFFHNLLHDSDKTCIEAFFPEFFLNDTEVFLSDLLWLKADQYHHAGNCSPKDIVSLCRMVTSLNPAHIEAYITGADQLSNPLERYDEAASFLQTGIDKNSSNPDLDMLYGELGYLHLFRTGDFASACASLEKAIQHYSGRKVEGDFYIPDNYLKMQYFAACLTGNSAEVKLISKKLSFHGLDIPDQETVTINFLENISRQRLSVRSCPFCGHAHGHISSGSADSTIFRPEPVELSEKHDKDNAVDSLHTLKPMGFQIPGKLRTILLKCTLLLIISIFINSRIRREFI